MLPEGSALLREKKLFGGRLELGRGHVHGLLHLGGGGGYEVLVDVHAEALLTQHLGWISVEIYVLPVINLV